jgi:hypothetical protein
MVKLVERGKLKLGRGDDRSPMLHSRLVPAPLRSGSVNEGFDTKRVYDVAVSNNVYSNDTPGTQL